MVTEIKIFGLLNFYCFLDEVRIKAPTQLDLLKQGLYSGFQRFGFVKKHSFKDPLPFFRC